MAIQLARSIGEQRKPISPLEGLPDIIQKIGNDIAGSLEKAGAEKKAKEQREQAYKDAVAARIKIDPTIASMAEENEDYGQSGTQGFANLAVMQRDPNVTGAKYEAAADDFVYKMKEKKLKYEKDTEALNEYLKRANEGTHDVSEFESFLLGTPDREVEETSPVDPSEIRMKRIDIERRRKADLEGVENEDAIRDVNAQYDAELASLETERPVKKTIKGFAGYKNLPYEEKKKIDLNEILEKKTIAKAPYMVEAARGVLGKDFDFKYVTTTTTDKGGIEYSIDEDRLKRNAAYVANMFANPPAVSPTKEFELLNRTIEKSAIANLADKYTISELQQRPELLAETKYNIAYNTFMNDANVAIEQDQLKLREEREKGKGGGMTFNFGQAEKNSRYSLPEQPLPERMKDLKTNEIGDYEYYPIQGKSEGSNKLIRTIANFGNVAVEGVYKNAKTNKIDYIKIVVPEKTETRFGEKTVIEPAKIKYVKPSGRELAEIATEVGETYFYGRTKAERPTSETIPTKKKEGTKPAEKQDYGTRSDGTPKGKGYFGELKMNDGSGKVATEISVKFDDVLGGAEIPTLVPTLSESEKQYLLKGNKPTKEIELKAIKHAEERASKGLSPFVDGGELKSKSGKPIYWDKTAKTYKYK